jgi:hypothetical protein
MVYKTVLRDLNQELKFQKGRIGPDSLGRLIGEIGRKKAINEEKARIYSKPGY